jgi:hypothetical protein
VSEQGSISVRDIESLADKLDALGGLDDADRAVLVGVFELAGRAAAVDEPDVEGFGIVTEDGATHGIVVINSRPALSFQGAFNLGFSNPGGAQMGGQPHM